MAMLKLSSPWVIFYREVNAMFEHDDEIHVLFDEDANEIKLFVDNATKADALTRLLPTVKQFGNVELKLTVIPADGGKPQFEMDNLDIDELFELAFEGNEAYCFSETIHGIIMNNVTYVIWKKEVVQYFTDNIGDYHGITSILYQDIARDIFYNLEGVYFCTDI